MGGWSMSALGKAFKNPLEEGRGLAFLDCEAFPENVEGKPIPFPSVGTV